MIPPWLLLLKSYHSSKFTKKKFIVEAIDKQLKRQTLQKDNDNVAEASRGLIHWQKSWT